METMKLDEFFRICAELPSQGYKPFFVRDGVIRLLSPQGRCMCPITAVVWYRLDVWVYIEDVEDAVSRLNLEQWNDIVAAADDVGGDNQIRQRLLSIFNLEEAA